MTLDMDYRNPEYVPTLFWRADGAHASNGYSLHRYDGEQEQVGHAVKTVQNVNGKWVVAFAAVMNDGKKYTARNMALLLQAAGVGFAKRTEKTSVAKDKTAGNMPASIAAMLAHGAKLIGQPSAIETAHRENEANGIARAKDKPAK